MRCPSAKNSPGSRKRTSSVSCTIVIASAVTLSYFRILICSFDLIDSQFLFSVFVAVRDFRKWFSEVREELADVSEWWRNICEYSLTSETRRRILVCKNGCQWMNAGRQWTYRRHLRRAAWCQRTLDRTSWRKQRKRKPSIAEPAREPRAAL